MKRKLLFLLSMLLIVCMVGSVTAAESWICPECATENDGNFCTNCGAKKPVSDENTTITNVTFTPQDNGDILVAWDDSADGNLYEIQYTTDDWEGLYGSGERFTGRQTLLRFLIPGVTYQVLISNGTSLTTVDYTVPRPVFCEFTAGKAYIDLSKNKFSLAALRKDPMASLQVQVSYPMLKRSRDYAAKLALKTPFGYSGTVSYWSSYTLENQYTYVYTPFYLMLDWLEDVEANFGSIPTGEYTFEMFMDGQLYGYATFTLTE